MVEPTPNPVLASDVPVLLALLGRYEGLMRGGGLDQHSIASLGRTCVRAEPDRPRRTQRLAAQVTRSVDRVPEPTRPCRGMTQVGRDRREQSARRSSANEMGVASMVHTLPMTAFVFLTTVAVYGVLVLVATARFTGRLLFAVLLVAFLPAILLMFLRPRRSRGSGALAYQCCRGSRLQRQFGG